MLSFIFNTGAENLLTPLTESALTSLGFFWKSFWAFVLGYTASALIQAFVPKKALIKYLGTRPLRSISLATLFGALSSSCSFAALSTARALFQRGAGFRSAVAFMFASTNLVIELGILIYIFLGWELVLAEVIGGVVLIALSSLLITLLIPQAWVEAARKRLAEKGFTLEADFDWRARIRSSEGWLRVADRFAMEWKMAWEDITIGFTVAGLVATLVPAHFWAELFLVEAADELPGWLIALENAAIAPFVAAATFIGSMGNIPLATVLASSGVLFAGLMGFIYSDLVVPPLVLINKKYYGWRIALAIAGVMYISIVLTALLLNGGFSAMGWLPESQRAVEEVTRFKVDYSFWLNIAFFLLFALLWGIYLVRKGSFSLALPTFKRGLVYACLLFLLAGALQGIMA